MGGWVGGVGGLVGRIVIAEYCSEMEPFASRLRLLPPGGRTLPFEGKLCSDSAASGVNTFSSLRQSHSLGACCFLEPLSVDATQRCKNSRHRFSFAWRA